MTSRRRESPRAGAAGPPRSSRYRHLVNPFEPVRIFSEDQVESMHLAALGILEKQGMRVLSPRGRTLLAAAGAQVDEATQMVRLDPGMVAAALTTVPREVNLVARNPERTCRVGGRNVIFAPVAGPPSVNDLERGKRTGTLADYRDLVRLAQAFDVIHVLGQMTEPGDAPVHERHLDTTLAQLTLGDKPLNVYSRGAGQLGDCFAMLRIAHGIDEETFRREPRCYSICNTNSPLQLDLPMTDGIIEFALNGQLMIVTPFTLAGAMAPITIAGALTLAHAEALFGITLSQLTRAGAPVMYGSFTSNVDMKSGSPAFGTPENTKANIASGQLARRYNLPYRTTPGSASNVADAQGTYETMMALWGAVLGHGNLVYHAAGWQEGGLTASYEKLIIDVEMIQHMMEFLRPIVVDEAELALDALGNVPTGGHFFGEPHTLERYATAFYQPILSNWQNYEAWQESGGLDATHRATKVWKKALEEYQEPAMDPARRDELEAYVAKRKEAIGSGEP